ncbi:MAG: hypothetical protein RLY31_1124 [Bacteroidota bacterium]
MNKRTTEGKWALVFAAMGLIWMWLEKAVGLHSTHIDQHPTYTNLIAIPAVLVYVLALRDKRRRDLDGRMTYGQAWVSGLVLTGIVTLLSPLTQYITSTVITPGYFPAVIAYAVDKGHMTQEAAEAYFNLKSYILQGLVFTPVMGLATTTVVAFFVRRS